MTIVKYYEISCDFCGYGDHPVANSEKDAESYALDSGWIKYKGKHFCCEPCLSAYRDKEKVKTNIVSEANYTKTLKSEKA